MNRHSLYRWVSKLLRLPLSGRAFKLYAPCRRWPATPPPPQLRILIANLMPSLGDTVCYTAMLELLREAHPQAQIDWLADGPLTALVAEHPAVDRVFFVTTPRHWMQRVPTLKTYYRLYTIMRSVRALQVDAPYDIVILPRGGVDPSFSAHAVWMLNLPRTVGYSHSVEPDEIGYNGGDALVTELVKQIKHPHEAARAVQLLEVTGLVPDALERFSTQMTLSGLAAIAAGHDKKAVLALAGVPEAPYIVLTPGAGVPNRAWPGDSYRKLCERIVAETACNVVVTGTAAEYALGELVVGGSRDRAFNATGKLSLAELVTLLRHATAFVGNDSGAGHIAGPLGVPVVSLHTQAAGGDPGHVRAPERGRALGPRVTILRPESFLMPCSECCMASGPHCIGQISVITVWAALQSLIAQDSQKISS